MLRKLHRPLYHSDPEYHASFAWCLTDSPDTKVSRTEEEGQDSSTAHPLDDPFDMGLIQELDEEFEAGLLSAQPVSGWKVDKIVLKIGKDMIECPI